MTPRKGRFPRRVFLRGTAAGATISLALPTLEGMLNTNGTAFADGTDLPCRFGVFYWGNGVAMDQWIPQRTGTDWALPPALEGFQDLREYLTHVTGTTHARTRPGHIPYRGLSLSSSHHPQYVPRNVGQGYRNQAMPAPSVDQIVAEHFGSNARWLGVGICRRGPYKSRVSWVKGGAAREHYSAPQRVFERLFTGVVERQDDPEPAPVFAATTALRRSMLDAVLKDAQAFQQRVGAVDRRRIDAHLTALREIERDLQARDTPLSPQCVVPESPNRSDFGDGSTREEKEAKHAIMTRLVAAALACDLTRVFSYEWSANQSGAVYWELGLSGGHHDLSHGNRGAIRQITRFIMDRYAELARAIRDQAEGDGTVLDRTLILGTSEHSDGAGHDSDDFPYVFVGKAGGAIRAGTHYRDPKPGRQNANAPKVLLTAARAVGVPLASLGEDSVGDVPERVATESIGALET